MMMVLPPWQTTAVTTTTTTTTTSTSTLACNAPSSIASSAATLRTPCESNDPHLRTRKRRRCHNNNNNNGDSNNRFFTTFTAPFEWMTRNTNRYRHELFPRLTSPRATTQHNNNNNSSSNTNNCLLPFHSLVTGNSNGNHRRRRTGQSSLLIHNLVRCLFLVIMMIIVTILILLLVDISRGVWLSMHPLILDPTDRALLDWTQPLSYSSNDINNNNNSNAWFLYAMDLWPSRLGQDIIQQVFVPPCLPESHAACRGTADITIQDSQDQQQHVMVDVVVSPVGIFSWILVGVMQNMLDELAQLPGNYSVPHLHFRSTRMSVPPSINADRTIRTAVLPIHLQAMDWIVSAIEFVACQQEEEQQQLVVQDAAMQEQDQLVQLQQRHDTLLRQFTPNDLKHVVRMVLYWHCMWSSDTEPISVHKPILTWTLDAVLASPQRAIPLWQDFIQIPTAIITEMSSIPDLSQAVLMTWQRLEQCTHAAQIIQQQWLKLQQQQHYQKEGDDVTATTAADGTMTGMTLQQWMEQTVQHELIQRRNINTTTTTTTTTCDSMFNPSHVHDGILHFDHPAVQQIAEWLVPPKSSPSSPLLLNVKVEDRSWLKPDDQHLSVAQGWTLHTRRTYPQLYSSMTEMVHAESLFSK